MVQSVLGSITLGYRPLWGRQRQLAGVQLHVSGDPGAHVDAPHLLRTLDELWSAESPPLLLSIDSTDLLQDLLEHGPAGGPRIAVPGAWLMAQPAAGHLAAQAHARGLSLVWRSDVRHLPPPALAGAFSQFLLSLQPEDAALALHASLVQRRSPYAPETWPASPVLPGHYYEDVASAALADHCLDQRQALALVGWPDDEVLQAHPPHVLTPSRVVIERLLRALAADQSMDVIEDAMSQDPLLCYRFLTLVNSAGMGLRNGIESLRHGLMMVGHTSLESWLRGQLNAASTAVDLQPVRLAMVIQARLMEHLVNAGVENQLRREMYLCGLFSQLDRIMDEPLGTILGRLPLSDRIYSANVTHSGPYAPGLLMARALASCDMARIRELRNAHEFDPEEVNRSLLRTLSNLRAHPAQ